MDQLFGNYGCVIMASGLGKRFGSNKLMADFCGKPLICRILDATEGLFASRVVVTRHKEVADLCGGRDIKVVLHALPYRSDTIRLGIEAVGDVDGCMFCPADQPLLRRETLAALISAAVKDTEAIWRICHEKIPGSPVFFPKCSFQELMTLPEGKGGSWVIKNHSDRVAWLNISDPYELMDADTPDVLNMLQQRYFQQKENTVIDKRLRNWSKL